MGGVEILTPREVPLGGLRAMTVRRTLPQRDRTLIGAWCFLDHYGPDEVSETGGMLVSPHPHTGLQTVSWLFSGEIDHADSAGNRAAVFPGELNLMTAGRGISHSEVSRPGVTTLHGAQLWVALPAGSRAVDPGFEHYAPPLVTGPGWRARVFLGSKLGSTSPVRTYSPLLGAEIVLEPGGKLVLPLDSTHEHGVLLDTGDVTVDDTPLKEAELAYAAAGATSVTVASEHGGRLLLLGGEPFGEQIVMWWNFIGRSHDEIVADRAEWQAQIAPSGEVVADSQQMADGRFGVVIGDHLPPIPAPELPGVRLKPRG
jgi:quercetin 2,3-dioxygenase